MKALAKRIYNGIVRRFENLLFYINIRTRKNIFVFGSPYHSNMGDQAQTYCIYECLKYSYPHYKIRIYDTRELTVNNYHLLHRIKKYINDKDLIFLHSGYHCTDLYLYEENMQRKVIQIFSDRRIVLLPQTINYVTKEQENISKYVYNEHFDLTLMCRDDVSHEYAKSIFHNANLLLFPDIVTTMIGKKKYNFERKGILLCLRNDKESMYSKDDVQMFVSKLSEIDDVIISDTTINVDAKTIKSKRKQILEEIWNGYAKYKVIITDRYHGTIFSLIAGTPVLVISSTDHKLSSGVKWFPNEFLEYVKYVNNVATLSEEVQAIYDKEFEYKLPSYFWDNYYKCLRQKLEEIK